MFRRGNTIPRERRFDFVVDRRVDFAAASGAFAVRFPRSLVLPAVHEARHAIEHRCVLSLRGGSGSADRFIA